MKEALINLFLRNKPGADLASRIPLLEKAIHKCLMKVKRLEKEGFTTSQAERTVNRAWNEAGKELIKKGYPFYKHDGFKTYMELNKPVKTFKRTK